MHAMRIAIEVDHWVARGNQIQLQRYHTLHLSVLVIISPARVDRDQH